MSKQDQGSQLTGMAGEFLTVGKLFKRGYQASVTFGNAKAIDVFVYNMKTNKSFTVQVKTSRYKNNFQMSKESIISDCIYIFVVLNKFEQEEFFYIVPGYDILADINKFYGASYRNPDKQSDRPAINYGPLNAYKDNWQVFDG